MCGCETGSEAVWRCVLYLQPQRGRAAESRRCSSSSWCSSWCSSLTHQNLLFPMRGQTVPTHRAPAPESTARGPQSNQVSQHTTRPHFALLLKNKMTEWFTAWFYSHWDISWFKHLFTVEKIQSFNINIKKTQINRNSTKDSSYHSRCFILKGPEFTVRVQRRWPHQTLDCINTLCTYTHTHTHTHVWIKWARHKNKDKNLLVLMFKCFFDHFIIIKLNVSLDFIHFVFVFYKMSRWRIICWTPRIRQMIKNINSSYVTKTIMWWKQLQALRGSSSEVPP